MQRYEICVLKPLARSLLRRHIGRTVRTDEYILSALQKPAEQTCRGMQVERTEF